MTQGIDLKFNSRPEFGIEVPKVLVDLAWNISKDPSPLMAVEPDSVKQRKREDEGGFSTQLQGSERIDASMVASGQDELRAVLTHQIELEIALRKRVASVIEARIAWAEQLKKALIKGNCPGQGKQVTPDPVEAKRQAIESFRALHAPLDLDPHTSHPRGSSLLASEPTTPCPSSTPSKYLYLVPQSSDHTLLLLSCPHPSCPTPHPSATLQGLLNHARIAHGPSYAYASHDDFLRSPGASTLIDAIQDPEKYARIVNEGVQVRVGGVRGLRELFEGAVESAGLGLSADTGELARLLGRKGRKGEIRAFGQGDIVDIESVDEPTGTERKRYGVLAPRRRRREAQTESAGEELNRETTASLAPEKAHAEAPTVQHAPNASRFHIKKRVVLSDWSRSLRKSSIQEGGPTHRWMIRLTAPSYSDHITTFLSAVRVQCASVPAVFEDTITCSSPPFAISRLSKQPFLARVILVFADANTKDIVITHWIDLDPVRSGSTTLGAEQIFDVELNKNAQLLPADTSADNVSNSILWSQDRGESDRSSDTQEPTSEVIVKSEPPAEISLSTEEIVDEKVPVDQDPEPIHDRLIPILSKLRARLPLTMEDAARVGHTPQVPYMLFDSREELLDAVHGRRKATEICYTRAMLRMLKADYTAYDADLEPILVDSLTVARLYAHLLAENIFPRPKLHVACVKVEENTPVPDEQVQSTSEAARYCGACGLDISRHPPTSRTLGPSKFACIASGSSQRPICDIGLWTTLRPLRENVQRVNLAPGAITTSGVRASLRGASQLVDCASPQITLAFHALTQFWGLRTFEYAAKRHNTNHHPEAKLPLEILGVDESHVDRTLAPHALLTLIAHIFVKRVTKEALRARSEMLGELSRVPGKSVLTSTHVSRALMDGRNNDGWLPLMAVARIGAIHSDSIIATGV
ncbi:unnamed protein product [Rhizoctonia solani]|uniref:YEATS domain-containing protein n=1 Tax=Rhizoctonia solani TaxID=456999 RepID=A0A8H3HLS1_9AGAM|nr:unnamed protein product [Rhizoctonia solani]